MGYETGNGGPENITDRAPRVKRRISLLANRIDATLYEVEMLIGEILRASQRATRTGNVVNNEVVDAILVTERDLREVQRRLRACVDAELWIVVNKKEGT